MKNGKNQQVILKLIDAVSENDKERILSFFADDTIFAHLEQPKATGQDEIWNTLSTVHDDAEEIDWQVDQLFEDESGAVKTEGRLRYLIAGDWKEYDICGSFEVKGSKIIHWK